MTRRMYDGCHRDKINEVVKEVMSKSASASKDLLCCDYCYLCARAVDPEKWREHMISHKMVLTETPKNENGQWKNDVDIKRAT